MSFLRATSRSLFSFTASAAEEEAAIVRRVQLYLTLPSRLKSRIFCYEEVILSYNRFQEKKAAKNDVSLKTVWKGAP